MDIVLFSNGLDLTVSTEQTQPQLLPDIPTILAMVRFNDRCLVLLILAALNRSFTAQALLLSLLQKNHLPKASIAVGTRPASALQQTTIDGQERNQFSTTRREAVIGSTVSLGSLLLPKEAGAAAANESTNDDDDDRPFHVLFSVRINDNDNDGPLEEIEIEVRPDWAPLAARRFGELVELGFYKDAPFFRVLPGYVAQFGISADPALNKQWVYCDASSEESKQLNCKPSFRDEPRLQSNKKGTLSLLCPHDATITTMVI